jgi:integrase
MCFAGNLCKTYADLMEDVTRIEDGRGVVYKRGGVYYARVRVGANKYVYRSLKTGKKAVAIKAAQRLVHQFEFRAEHNIPISIKKFVDVLDEYEAYRKKQHERGSTTAQMLRQIVRVNKFWREFAGKRLITSMDNAALRDFVEWRRAYYSNKTEAELKLIRNYKLNPSDKTLQWDVTHGKAVLKWAHEKGYMGKDALPTFTFVPKLKRVRPAFEIGEYKRLYQTLRKRTFETTNAAWKHTRLILRDYVLILSNSGMRIGELNKIKLGDIHPFTDKKGRPNYRFIVKGKTGPRDVILRASAKRWVDRQIERRKEQKAKDSDYLFVMFNGGKIVNLIDQFSEVLKVACTRAHQNSSHCSHSFTGGASEAQSWYGRPY